MNQLSSSTHVRLTIPQMWMIVSIVFGGAVSACGIYYGIRDEIAAQRVESKSEFADVGFQLQEMKSIMHAQITKEEFIAWIDSLRASNPKQHIPALP